MHKYFDKNKINEVFKSITFILTSLKEPFKEEGECRLANILYEGLLSEKIEQETFKSWVETLDFSLNDNKDFYRLATFKSMLAYIYFHSLDNINCQIKLDNSSLHM